MSEVLAVKAELALKPNVTSIVARAQWLKEGEMRLDASFYSRNSQRAFDLLVNSGYELKTIKDFAKRIFNPPPIKRQFSDSKGTPYLMPSELFYFRLKPTKYVFAEKMPDIEDWYVKSGWTIVTQSGIAGIPFFGSRALEKFIISQNLVRIVPINEKESGYIYAYLSTWIGNALVTKDQFGVTVEHIRPHHVESVAIPNVPQEIKEQIHDNIVKVFALRDRARELCDRADELLMTKLGLEDPKVNLAKELGFHVNFRNLNFRLDASYHHPAVKKIIRMMRAADLELHELGEVSRVSIAPRFKRIYVAKEFGVPFLQGTNIAQLKPRDMKYISKTVTENLEKWIVHKDWVLITCSGTVGRVAYAPSQWDSWAVSQHVMRIEADPSLADSGYIAAFLSCPYGQVQFVSLVYGAIVDEAGEADAKKLVIPIPPMKIQSQIGDLVKEAFELKETANRIENDTILTLEDMLANHSHAKDIEQYLKTFQLIANDELRASEGVSQEKKGQLRSWEELMKETGFS